MVGMAFAVDLEVLTALLRSFSAQVMGFGAAPAADAADVDPVANDAVFPAPLTDMVTEWFVGTRQVVLSGTVASDRPFRSV